MFDAHRLISGIIFLENIDYLVAFLYARIPNANSGTGTIWCETYSGSTFIGDASTSFTFKVTNSNPVFTVSQLTYQDTNGTVTAITNNNQLIVRNKSTLNCTFTSTTAQNSATISKYQTIFNGVTTDRSSAGTYSFRTVNSAQNLTLKVKAIDSRGNSTTISKTVTILDWVMPIINATATRVNNYENETNLLANVQISNVNGLNSIGQLQYRLKKTSDSVWNSWIDFLNNTQTQINLDNLFAWDLQIQATDKFSTTTHNLAIPKGMPICFFDTQKLSVGINCFPAKSNSLEVNGQTIFDMIYPVGVIYMSVSSIDPGTLFGGTWSQLQNRFLIGAGSSYIVNSTGGASTVTLASGNMPSHTHSFSATTGSAGSHTHGLPRNNSGSAYREAIGYTTSATRAQTTDTDSAGSHNHSVSGRTGSSGSSNPTAVNKMPPYLVVYMWKRTA